MKMSKPATPQELLDLLENLEMEVTTRRHQAVFTVEESAEITAQIPGGHTKNLFLKDKKDNLFLIVAESEARIPVNKIHPLVGAKSRLSFANAERLMEHLGVEPGSVTAFAPINDHDRKVRVVIDEPLLAHSQINCHPLINTMTTTISRQDLLRFLDHVDHTPAIMRLSTPVEPSQQTEEIEQ